MTGADGETRQTAAAASSSRCLPTRRAVPEQALQDAAQFNKLDIDGWAHHPYTTRKGPRYRPPARDAVMIGTLSRLRRALDRAGRAGAQRPGRDLLTIRNQSKPDPIYGVSQTRQAEWRALAEQIAFRNDRVRAFSQYLMRDDAKQGRRASGFESACITRRPPQEGLPGVPAADDRDPDLAAPGAAVGARPPDGRPDPRQRLPPRPRHPALAAARARRHRPARILAHVHALQARTLVPGALARTRRTRALGCPDCG